MQALKEHSNLNTGLKLGFFDMSNDNGWIVVKLKPSTLMTLCCFDVKFDKVQSFLNAVDVLEPLMNNKAEMRDLVGSLKNIYILKL